DDLRVDRLLPGERHDFALGPPAYRPGQVRPGRGRLAAGEDEALQWLQARVEAVDGGLQARDLCGRDAKTPLRFLVARGGHAQVGADVEQVVLDAAQQVRLGGLQGQEQAEQRVQLVDGAVSGDAWVVLGDAGAVAEAGVAAVAGFGVNAREV